MAGKALYGRIARVESREITFILIQEAEKEWELSISINAQRQFSVVYSLQESYAPKSPPKRSRSLGPNEHRHELIADVANSHHHRRYAKITV